MFRKIDHILIQADCPSVVLSVLADTLGLPVNVSVAEHSGFESCSLIAGNVTLEIARSAGQPLMPPLPGGVGGARLLSLALEPVGPLDSVARMLARQNFIPSEPKVHRGPPPDSYRPFMTAAQLAQENPKLSASVTVGGVIESMEDPWQVAVQISEYYHDLRGRQAREARTLQKLGGGPLGILGIHAILIQTPHKAMAMDRWKRFLCPVDTVGPNALFLDDGPGLWFERGDTEHYKALILRVKSRSAAIRHLRNQGLLHPGRQRQIRLCPDKVCGLDIRLI